MPKKAHTEEQIVAVLRQVEAGARVMDVCRKVGISEATRGDVLSLEAAVFRGRRQRAS
jgi:hypothetical protein